MPEQSQPRIAEVGIVSVSVTDLDRALGFYVDSLGFEKRIDASYGDDARWVEVAPEGSQTTIALVRFDEVGAPGVETGIRLVVLTTNERAGADVEAVRANLQARGVDVDRELLTLPGAPPMFSLRDPDGNLLRVVARHM